MTTNNLTFEKLFKIGNTWLYPPDSYQEFPVPTVGYNLRGEPIKQGYPSIVFGWQIMLQDRLTALFSVYDPNNPRVQIQYIDKLTGALTTKWAMMEEPVVQSRLIIYYQNISVKFTRITDGP